MPKTLAELLNTYELFGVCTSCHRTEVLDIRRLTAAHSKDYPIAKIRQRVRCINCGRKTNDIRIVYTGSCGNFRGFHYRKN